MALTRCTSATSTISMAMMLSSSSRPAAVPFTMASMVLSATGADVDSADVGALVARFRHHHLADQMAAGALSTEATSRWPATSGNDARRMVA